MARITTTQLIDDLDGAVLDEGVTITWGLDGKQYELDTSQAHADAMRKKLEKYIEASRRASATTSRPAAPVTRSKEHLQAIRDWAQANGHEVNSRGRIPGAVVDAFEAAH